MNTATQSAAVEAGGPHSRVRAKGAGETQARQRRAQRIAQAVVARREQLGISITEAARRADVSWPTWQRLEQGRQDTFKPRTVKAVAKALQWPDDFMVRLRSGADLDDLAVVPSTQTVLREIAHDLIDRMDELQLKALIYEVVGDAVTSAFRAKGNPIIALDTVEIREREHA